MEAIRKNFRLVVTFLCLAVILLVMFKIDDGKRLSSEQVQDNGAEVKINNQTDGYASENVLDDEESSVGTQPSTNQNESSTDDEIISAIIEKGECQTVVVRRIISDYLQKKSQSIKPEQKLYIETVVVDSLPRNDLVFAGQEITLNEYFVSKVIDDSTKLSDKDIENWATYL